MLARIVTRFYVASIAFFALLPHLAIKAQGAPRHEALQYYRQEFEARYKYPMYDTLFEKIVWERKVSHLAMEIHSNEYRVTMLMMQEYPHNYKSQNYPIYFAFKTFADAATKFEALNLFLRNNGVMAVGLNGARIVHEKILVHPKGSSPPRPVLGSPLGDKTTDPILTREALPRRLPLDSALSR